MAENRIELDTGTGELLCEILDRVAAGDLKGAKQLLTAPRRATHYLTV